MKNNIRKIGLIVLSFIIISTMSITAFAKETGTVSIGKDLNQDQRRQMLDHFGAEEGDNIIEVSNQEERKYLGEHVPSKQLGSRAISSSYVKPSRKGSGIKVETYNIDWVTEDMLISALVTAGVQDADVKVAAPFKVSGTAALTGIIKGFEGATGTVISEIEKEVASEEIAKTGQLADDIGKEEASQIMNRVKEEVVEGKLKDPAEIKKIIEREAQAINIELTEEQKEKIEELMVKISNLDLNVEDIKSQLKNISSSLAEKLDDLRENSDEIKSVLDKILEGIRNIFDKIASFFN